MNQRFFEELQRAIKRGFTLAAVSASLSCTRPAPARTESAAPVDAGTPVAIEVKPRLRDADGGSLAQVPAASIRCFGDGNEPFHGGCCTHVHCYTPTSDTCVEPIEIAQRLGFTPRLPIGSGTCFCGQTAGPFAQPDGGVAECCYVVGTMGCSGRPLREDESTIVAPVVMRADWA